MTNTVHGGGCRKFFLLLWKNWTLQKRHRLQTTFEVLIPLIFTMILVVIRGFVRANKIEKSSFYPEFDPKIPYGTFAIGGKYILFAPNSVEVTNLINITQEEFAAIPSAEDILSGFAKRLNLNITDANATAANLGINDTVVNTLSNYSTYDNSNQTYLPKYKFIGYSSEDALLKGYTTDSRFEQRLAQSDFNLRNWTNQNPVLCAVIFKTNPDTNHIKYTLRFPIVQHATQYGYFEDDGGRWKTELLFPLFQKLGPRQPVAQKEIPQLNELEKLSLNEKKRIATDGHRSKGGEPGYSTQGFLFLQSMINTAILKYKVTDEGSQDVLNATHILLNRFPHPKYIDDFFIFAVRTQLPIYLVLSFIYPVVNIAKSVVHEKERRLKESMKMMGLPNWLHWGAWFTKSFLFLAASAILMSILYKIPFYGNGLSVLTYADGSVLFVFLLCYIFSAITLAFFVSVFFSTANAASITAGVVFFVSFFPYTLVARRFENLSFNTKIALTLFSNTAMGFGTRIISSLEGTGEGARWTTIQRGASYDEDIALVHVMMMFIVDGLIYLLLALYIEGVRPGSYGIPLPWYFPFTQKYWCGAKSKGREDSQVHPADPEADSQEDDKGTFEKGPPDMVAGIEIIGLTKVFGKKVAVNNLSISFYENQVTALLGHNGAGKTTTMSMITGLFPPTSGTVLVKDFDIRTDIKSVRESLGLCPQHDVLFDEMTVEEHLKFFCLLKGLKKSMLKAEVERMLTALQLENKRHAQSKTLSGGMKRKLSVGIALCAGSKVVLLDEPTSGMDPSARRSTWDLISNEKKGRTIVLSTHFMDEADILGDRIVIMVAGAAICAGTPLFLKKRYGEGYHLIIVKGQNCQVGKITELLQKHIPEVDIDQDIGAELSYSLPDGKSNLFPAMFAELEYKKSQLGIDSYGCSITQMEEVFIRVGEEAEEEKQEIEAKSNTTLLKKPLPSLSPSKQQLNDDVSTQKISKNPLSEPVKSNSTVKLIPSEVHNEESKTEGDLVYQRNSGCALYIQQFRAMFVKKALYCMRNKVLLMVQAFVPAFFLILALIFIKTLPNLVNPIERSLDLADYTRMGRPITTLQCQHPSLSEFRHTYEKVASEHSTVVNTGGKPLERYLISMAEKNLAEANFKYMIGLKCGTVKGIEIGNNTENKTKTKMILNGFFNNQPFHTPPVALNFIWNAVLRNTTGNSNLKLSISNFPLPYTSRDQADNLTSSTAFTEGFQVGFFISFGLTFLAASFIIFLVKERETKSKHLQFVSGAKFPIFWLAHFLFDCINYLLSCFFLMIVLLAFNVEDFQSEKMQILFLIILLIYGWSVLPLMYLFSFVFTVPSSAFIRMIFFNFITGVALLLTWALLIIPDIDMAPTSKKLEWAFLIFPNFNVGHAIALISQNNKIRSFCPHLPLDKFCKAQKDFICCIKYPIDFFAWENPGILRNVVYMTICGIICHILLFMVEFKVFQPCARRTNIQTMTEVNTDETLEDSDVAEEMSRIRSVNPTNQLTATDTLILKDLTKYYKNFLAVNNLCLGIKQGECFGLLGVNGAGKTTTFKMLTGDIPISLGDAFITNKSVTTDIEQVQKVIGYCPQFDALIPELTGRESIRLFARLRGIKEADIGGLVDKLAQDLLFTQHVEKPCGTYSGGNKRKLSTALALIGNPPLVFLDEPTTGMDPVARRQLWNCIIKIRSAGTSIVLTSHSMEECEALCTRLSIMVNGRFRCLGSPQHLRDKFGDGYTILAQINSSSLQNITRTSVEMGRRRSSVNKKPETWEAELLPLRNYIEEHFPGSQLTDIHPAYIHYHIPDDGSVTWGEIFKIMEEAKGIFNLDAYSVGQTTLEQVFLGFAKAQCNEDE